jgi:hypothetical protein
MSKRKNNKHDFLHMKIGDSFISDSSQQSLCGSISYFRKTHPECAHWVFTTRQLERGGKERRVTRAADAAIERLSNTGKRKEQAAKLVDAIVQAHAETIEALKSPSEISVSLEGQWTPESDPSTAEVFKCFNTVEFGDASCEKQCEECKLKYNQ